MERRGRGGNWEVWLWAAPGWVGHGGGQGTDRPSFAGFDGAARMGMSGGNPPHPGPLPPLRCAPWAERGNGRQPVVNGGG